MRKILLIGAVILIVLGAIYFGVFKKGPAEQQVSEFDAIDTVGDFYFSWLKATKEPSSDVNRSTLAKSPILSKTLRDRLVKAVKSNESPDPVLCQTSVPEDISLRGVYEDVGQAQVLVMSRDREVTDQALVTLLKYNDGWYINEITCSLGEVPPEREFSFEKEGFLLKDSIPAPYNSANWHLVFEENGVPGHVVPLFFDSESQCTDGGNTSVCNPGEFIEATKVFVRGQMSERGASVNQLEFVK